MTETNENTRCCNTANDHQAHECCHHHHHHTNHETVSGCGCGGHHHAHQTNEPQPIHINLQGEIEASVETIWETLVYQDTTLKWLPKFHITDPRPGGEISFDDATYLIMDFDPMKQLSFLWEGGVIEIQLEEIYVESTAIHFSYIIESINERSAYVLTDWVMALQNLSSVVKNEEPEHSLEKYNKVLVQMQSLLESQGSIEIK